MHGILPCMIRADITASHQPLLPTSMNWAMVCGSRGRSLDAGVRDIAMSPARPAGMFLVAGARLAALSSCRACSCASPKRSPACASGRDAVAERVSGLSNCLPSVWGSSADASAVPAYDTKATADNSMAYLDVLGRRRVLMTKFHGDF